MFKNALKLLCWRRQQRRRRGHVLRIPYVKYYIYIYIHYTDNTSLNNLKRCSVYTEQKWTSAHNIYEY